MKDIKVAYANTHKQPLDQHLFAVGIVAEEVMKSFTSCPQLQRQAQLAGFWHDIGKLETQFQLWLNKEIGGSEAREKLEELPEDGVHIEKGKFSWEKYPTHNEVSCLIYQILAPDEAFAYREHAAIKHAIYWHHAKPRRSTDMESLTQVEDKLNDGNLKELLAESYEVLTNVNHLALNYLNKKPIDFGNYDSEDLEEKLAGKKLPEYKSYCAYDTLERYQKQVKTNAQESLIRAAVITADRLVSSLTAKELQKHIEEKSLKNFTNEHFEQDAGLGDHIKKCLKGFDERYPNSVRNEEQAKAAKNLADEEVNIGVLNGPAGCGKTKIALEWALHTGSRKIIWVCPRVAICQSLFKDLSSGDYLPGATIEIHTGEFKYTNNQTLEEQKIFEENTKEHLKGDIILTTIDQIIEGLTTHKNISRLSMFMTSSVVFDEFHEYVAMPGFNLLFGELISCKKLQQNEDITPSTLLVSATPNYSFVKNFLLIHETEIASIPSFNDKKYKIEFKQHNEKLTSKRNLFNQPVDKNSFVISNTATTAQKSFIMNQEEENSSLVHSRFSRKDKEEIFDNIINSFKQEGTHKFDIVRSGPLIQASLNISCKNMISEMSSAENTLQRIGRLNRFAEFSKANLTIVITAAIKENKQKGPAALFLGKSFQWKSTQAWITFLQNKTESKKGVTLANLYSWYEEFYETESCLKMVENDLLGALKESVRVLKINTFDPIRMRPAKGKKNLIKARSLRGTSRFVKMAEYDAKNRTVLDTFLKESITLSQDEIENYDEPDSALEFMAKKHHNLVEGVQKEGKRMKLVYLGKALDPETPIYVSYTEEMLMTINASAAEGAIYYVQGVSQAIGVMFLANLKKG